MTRQIRDECMSRVIKMKGILPTRFVLSEWGIKEHGVIYRKPFSLREQVFHLNVSENVNVRRIATTSDLRTPNFASLYFFFSCFENAFSPNFHQQKSYLLLMNPQLRDLVEHFVRRIPSMGRWICVENYYLQIFLLFKL